LRRFALGVGMGGGRGLACVIDYFGRRKEGGRDGGDHSDSIVRRCVSRMDGMGDGMSL
jgi:hypothetical protein